MEIKICLLFLAFCCVEIIVAAPTKDEEVMQKFVQFLHEDKEISSILEKAHEDPEISSILEKFELAANAPMTRHRRQSNDPIPDDENLDDLNKQKEAGFFDRAAKFMMEVLQRFLKWVNA